MVRHVYAAQALLDNSTWRVKNGESPVDALSLLKVEATRCMEFCAREAMQILGGAGFIRGHRVERIYREVRVMAIGGGSKRLCWISRPDSWAYSADGCLRREGYSSETRSDLLRLFLKFLDQLALFFLAVAAAEHEQSGGIGRPIGRDEVDHLA